VADAERLAEELAFAVARLDALVTEPPGLYAEVAAGGDLEERTWLAFQIAFACPLDAAESEAESEPFAGIREARRSWASGEAPALQAGQAGPRNGGDAARGARTSAAYRSWAQRLGSQAAGIGGDAAWSPQRRFDRVCERLGTLASMDRAPRYDMLVTLGRLGVYELVPDRLHLGGSDPVTLAAKRILGIGDPLLLERRAAELAQTAGVPIEALDLGFFNWERGARFTGGLPASSEPDPTALASARSALGVG
jgi:hypothetical protein